METLLDGIPLADITTSMTINGPAAAIWAMYIAAAEKRGVSRAQLGGTLQNDILKEFIAQKEFLYPPRPSMRLVVDTIEFGTPHLGARDARDLRREGSAFVVDALPHADRRRLADGPAARGEPPPHDAAGARRGARRHAVAAHQLDGRSDRAPQRARGDARAAHPAGDRPRVRRREHRRPAWRQLLRREAHRRDGARRLRLPAPHRRLRRH